MIGKQRRRLMLCPFCAASAHPPTRPPARTPSAAGHWVLVEGGEEALKEALLLKGPMVVSSEPAGGGFPSYLLHIFQ